jgi:hypothetical protein
MPRMAIERRVANNVASAVIIVRRLFRHRFLHARLIKSFML